MTYDYDRADRFWEAMLWGVVAFTVSMIVNLVASVLGVKMPGLTPLMIPLSSGVIAGIVSWHVTGRAGRK